MPATSDIRVRVRMYRQGLGDCFLLTFWHTDDPEGSTSDKAFHMLIDCGVLQTHKTPAQIAQDLKTMNDIVGNIREITKNHLNLLVATHRHWDHISGFLQAEKVFAKMQIDALWVPWTEEDTEATRKMWKRSDQTLKAIYDAHKLYLQQNPPGTAATSMRESARAAMWSNILGLLDFQGNVVDGQLLGANGVRMDKYAAMRSIINKVGSANTRFLESAPGGHTLKPFSVQGCSGVRFYVLGPSRSLDSVKKMKSTKKDPNDDIYEFRAAALAEGLGAAAAHLTQASTIDRFTPFDEKYTVPVEEARVNEEFFKAHYAQTWRGIDNDWLDFVSELALYLDDFTNNTSLALAIELVNSQHVLLFVGDAQQGNWESWQEREWPAEHSGGQMPPVRIEDLFNRTILYKVGHHGSHNATLSTQGLELMKSDSLAAMIPVDKKTARAQVGKNTPNGWEMPAHKLLEVLQERTQGRILEADEPPPTDAQLVRIPKQRRQQFLKAVTSNKLWIDLEIGEQ